MPPLPPPPLLSVAPAAASPCVAAGLGALPQHQQLQLLHQRPQPLMSPAGVFGDLDLEPDTHNYAAAPAACVAPGGAFGGGFAAAAAAAGGAAAAATTSTQRLMALCCDASPLATRLTQDLDRLRASYARGPASSLSSLPLDAPASGDYPAPSSASASASASPNSAPLRAAASASASASAAAGASPCSSSDGGSSFGGSPSELLPGELLDDGDASDVAGLTRELLAAGYLVQLRDEAADARPRDARSCLHQLRHRFIFCLGARQHWGDALPPPAACAGFPANPTSDARNLGDQQARHRPPLASWPSADGRHAVFEAAGGDDGQLLPEPLVVEPSFRDQFVIAHPTPAYTELLAAVPLCFVGTVQRLEAAVTLLCQEMAAAFKQQGLPIPPWRTKKAMLSKWGPGHLAAITTKIQSARGGGHFSAPHAATGPATPTPAASAAADEVAAAALMAAFAPAPAAAQPPVLLSLPPTVAAAPLSLVASTTYSSCATATSSGTTTATALASASSAAAAAAAPSVPGGTLGFVRKASAEWRSQPQDNSKKVRSLLAAALQRSGSPRPMAGVEAASSPTCTAAAAAAAAAAHADGLAAVAAAVASPPIRTVALEAGLGCIRTVRLGAAQVQ
jgi:uncharacterized protein (TIGR01615 family)